LTKQQQKDHSLIIGQCRALINAQQFNNEPFGVLLVLLESGLRAMKEFIDSKLMKHLPREIRKREMVVAGREVKWTSGKSQWNGTDGG
jgi:hypothetical protein